MILSFQQETEDKFTRKILFDFVTRKKKKHEQHQT